MLEVNSKIRIPLRELDFSYSRSPGPGGQNVNKLNTKVTLKWDVANSPQLPEPVRARFLEKYHRRISKEGLLVVTSSRFRNQGRNVGDAMHKLREMLLSVAQEPAARKRRKPSAAQRRQRLQDKRKTSEKKRLRRPPDSD